MHSNTIYGVSIILQYAYMACYHYLHNRGRPLVTIITKGDYIKHKFEVCWGTGRVEICNCFQESNRKHEALLYSIFLNRRI
jgi:hypothetical protein